MAETHEEQDFTAISREGGNKKTGLTGPVSCVKDKELYRNNYH
jgi:hypothetical protein